MASGCLGSEVRIWNVARQLCANIIHLENSIISLAFHPEGNLVAISSGSQLHTWDWREGMASNMGGYAMGSSPFPSRRTVVHPRNIRYSDRRNS